LPVTLNYLRAAKNLLKQDVKDFAHLVNLKYVDLQNTEVYGDIKAFYGMKNLENLHLQNTKVTGNPWLLPLSVAYFKSNSVE